MAKTLCQSLFEGRWGNMDYDWLLQHKLLSDIFDSVLTVIIEFT